MSDASHEVAESIINAIKATTTTVKTLTVEDTPRKIDSEWGFGMKIAEYEFDVIVRETKSAEPCTKSIHAGPGHQSAHQCVVLGEHHHHTSRDIGYYYEWSTCHERSVSWSDELYAFSGVFDESPGHCEIHDPITGEEL